MLGTALSGHVVLGTTMSEGTWLRGLGVRE